MLVIFPFEAEWYRARGVEAEFVGHPLAEEQVRVASREEFAARFHLDPLKPWIALLPGSRRKEVAQIGPPLAYAATLLGDEFEYVVPVAPSLDANEIAPFLSGTIMQRASGDRPQHSHAKITLTYDAVATLAHSRAAVVASGTATVQAALTGTPFVMVYRVAPFSYLLGRWMVRVPHFAMPNLIAGRRIIPELVQREFTATNVVRELRKILPDGAVRNQMLKDLAEVRARLTRPHGSGELVSATDRAAAAVLETIHSSGHSFDQSAQQPAPRLPRPV
jgi:lipid-A-disaccharide synthase